MKRKFFLSAAIALLPLGAAFAHSIKVTTSCGTTRTIESSDYKTMDQMMKAVQTIEDRDCG